MQSPSHQRTTTILIALGVFMLTLSFASVPLYRLFCQKTGFGGTPKIGAILPKEKGQTLVTVAFNADVYPGLSWSFKPLQESIQVRPGEQGLAFYRAKNFGSIPIKAMATYNVTPDKAGPYFSKIDCFCFVEQILQPGQEVDMPVVFYLDPLLEKEQTMREVRTITLSYTFFKLP